jgi:hypothetical protein
VKFRPLFLGIIFLEDGSGTFLLTNLHKPGERTVISFFHVSREKARGDLLSLAVMCDTFTALAAPLTVISADTIFLISFERTF